MQAFLLPATSQDQNLSAEISLSSGRVLHASISPLQGEEGETTGHVAVFRDITALKELEQARLQVEREKRERYQQVLQRYVSPLVVDRLIQQGTAMADRPELREVVVLYADLRGFTETVGSVPPSSVVEDILNPYFTRMNAILHRYEATIDKFIGDAILAYFGFPFCHGDEDRRALHAATEMQQEMAHLNREWKALLGRGIGMGIGLARGEVVIGNVGSAQRSDYTAIGLAINVANRLQEMAAAGEVLLEATIAERLPPEERDRLAPLGSVWVKGCRLPVTCLALRTGDRNGFSGQNHLAP